MVGIGTIWSIAVSAVARGGIDARDLDRVDGNVLEIADGALGFAGIGELHADGVEAAGDRDAIGRQAGTVDLLGPVGTGEEAGIEQRVDRTDDDHLVTPALERRDGNGGGCSRWADETRTIGAGSQQGIGGERQKQRQQDASMAMPGTGPGIDRTEQAHQTQYYSRNATTLDASASCCSNADELDHGGLGLS